MRSDLTINVAHYELSSLCNGPGMRFVLWVQGCTLACPGCMNPVTHAGTKRNLMGVEEVFAGIQAVRGLEGVTFSGGEPFQQARALNALCKRLRMATRLSIMAYTGYSYEYLLNHGDRWQKELLGRIDILVDGPFIMRRQSPLMWRGSQNQRVLFLTDRYSPESVGLEDGPRRMEIHVAGAGNLVRTGFPFEWRRLIRALKHHNVEISNGRRSA